MGEGSGRKALEDEADAVPLLGLAEDAEGIVDMALAVADSAQQRLGEIVGGQDFREDGIVFRD